MAQSPSLFRNVDYENDTGKDLADLLNFEREALLSAHSGPTAPTYARIGTEWLDTSVTPNALRRYTAENRWVAMGYVDPETGDWTPAYLDAALDQAAEVLAVPVQEAQAAAQAAAASAASIDPDRLPVKQPVKVATTANVTLSGLQSVDGVALSAGDRVLVCQQTDTTQNGIYVVASGSWTRSTDANAAGSLSAGTLVPVEPGGTSYGGSIFSLTAPAGVITPGVSAVTWSDSYKMKLAAGSVAAPSFWFEGHAAGTGLYSLATNVVGFAVGGVQKVVLYSYGVLSGTTYTLNPITDNVAGCLVKTTGQLQANADGAASLQLGRKTSDGGMIALYRDTVAVATVSVASGVVTWGTFVGSHWSRFEGGLMPDILPGTVLEALDLPVLWDDDPGYPHLPMCKVSDTPASPNVYGVFFAYDMEDEHHDLHVASLGAYYVRMAAGQTPQMGDYLESAGDGTARVQPGVALLNSTIGKVTGTRKLAVYPDGSFLVPCTLHCG